MPRVEHDQDETRHYVDSLKFLFLTHDEGSVYLGSSIPPFESREAIVCYVQYVLCMYVYMYVRSYVRMTII